MDTNRNKHRRRSVRLQGYDYSQTGAYFVTICTQERVCLFGEIVDSEIRLNEAGRVVERCWLDVPQHFPHIELDAFVVMPNHVHGIVVITDGLVGAKNFSPLPQRNTASRRPTGTPSGTIGSMIRGFKIGVTKWFRVNLPTQTVWQRNYHEHVIRNDDALNRIRQYILDNPLQWAFDRENPVATIKESEDVWLT